MAELRRLSDDQLADIGLTRADVAELRPRPLTVSRARSTSVRHSPIATVSAGR